ncbi:serine/threonine-protein kinase AFC3 isoform X2 [Gastrolobium bilobum]|uniref:serine/threonine-protein kinase AFC3 isoform X2 n=1 Tax=Gastrolobium bilobum TaxID=150636 RepID=UPI002AAF89CC|nr:serine/threonine-protein kinase AFC3 isoform X2 [Gastrolobium bilobum]
MVSVETKDMERKRNRKRPRLAWDVPPPPLPEAQRALVVAGEEGIEKRHASPPKRDDDREGHYVFNLGENLTPRYKILSKMGEGTFGRVLECWDRQTREYVAIKVIRSIRKYRDAAMLEVDVLQNLAQNDRGSSGCVQIRNWFDYRNHICIVFEKLGPSLFDFLKRNKYCPFPVDLVREFGRQLLESVACLGWSYPCDLWSVGCILVELCSGGALFQTHENLEHLAMMERVLGPLPEHMVRRSNRGAEKYFRNGSRLNWPEGAVSRESIHAVKKLAQLKDIVSRHVDSSRSSFTDLLHGLLTYDTTKRLTARQALDHPFFRNPT